MEIIFICNNCNSVFVENEFKAMIDNSLITRVNVFMTDDYANLSIKNHPKFHFYNYTYNHKTPMKWKYYGLFLKELVVNRSRYGSISKIRSAFSRFRNEVRKAYFIINSGISPKAVLYSYWAADEAFILSWIKLLGYKNMGITRLHAFDIYEEFDNRGTIPWRWFILNKIDRFCTISEDGKKYLSHKYPHVKDRTQCFYLGIENAAHPVLNRAPKDCIRVVSCGWMNPHKNHIQIYEALNGVENAQWFHIGSGDEMNRIQKLSDENGKIKIQFLGLKTKEEIQEIYANVEFTCFMSLSTTEGLPVSMMEAMAYGMPIISTDVGGCRELVNAETGVLLPVEYTLADVRNAVEVCNSDTFTKAESRLKIQKYGFDHFNADTNYNIFFDYLYTENAHHNNASVVKN